VTDRHSRLSSTAPSSRRSSQRVEGLAQGADIDVRGGVWPRAQWISSIGGLSDDVEDSVADHVGAEARQVHYARRRA
jgi:hypothetical protein